MQILKKIKDLFESRLKLAYGTRLISFLFIACSIIIAAGVLFAANMYYNIDTQEVVTEEIQRVTGTLRATAGLIIGGSADQDPAAGTKLEIASDDVLLSAASQLLRFSGGTSYYVGFQADTGITTTTTYTWPTTYPTSTGDVLRSTIGGTLSWLDLGEAGLGDVLAVGDCPDGECFTADGAGNTLWFEGATADTYEITLTAADPGADYTITLPAATGYVALGTSTANYVAYWTSTSTLAGEQYLSTSRGGIGENTSAWDGMVQVVGGNWGPITGTTDYAAYWSDDNTVAAEQYLALSRGGTAAGLTADAGGIVYSGASALAISAVGSSNQVLTSGGAGAPNWSNIADLITVSSGLTESGTTALTIKLGGTLTATTTIAQANYDMIFDLTGTGKFKVQAGGSDLFTVTDDGRVLFKTYAIAESGKQILREMIPILGFDLPAQTATTSYVQISRVLEDYPFASAFSGTTRVHKFVIRYADATTTASTTWRVYNETDSTTTATFEVPATASADLGKGEAYITSDVTIPIDTDDWRLDLMTSGATIRVYQIFLAAYDEVD